tara:strand:+ start:82 stop:450 length:369 start_codon:yes stop_codon:yes gene_type:complete
VITFLKQIFTWWHRQTVGTFIYTLFTGKLMGKDQFGNKYYKNSKDRRWVIFKNNIEASKIPPEWHAWIHFTNRNVPLDENEKFSWQKKYVENLTGTSEAYKPDGSLTSESQIKNKKYETWKH